MPANPSQNAVSLNYRNLLDRSGVDCVRFVRLSLELFRSFRLSAESSIQFCGASPTPFITGNAPVPVPTTRRRHFHGIPSSSENGVCPKASRNFFEAFFTHAHRPGRSLHRGCSSLLDAYRAKRESFESHGIISSRGGRRIAVANYSNPNRAPIHRH